MNELTICNLFPDLLGTYGDNGNARVLSRRLEWRQIPCQLVDVLAGDPVPDSADIYLLGGAEDAAQVMAADLLNDSRSLHRAVDLGAVVLAICAGFQLVGSSFSVAGDRTVDGLGLLDAQTVRGPSRAIGEVVITPSVSLPALVGYENHGGRTLLGEDAKAFGEVIVGIGNSEESGVDGAISADERVIGTYLHGPVLARNARMADWILAKVTGELEPLDDDAVDRVRRERLEFSLGSKARQYV